jgi:hypothetical protein
MLQSPTKAQGSFVDVFGAQCVPLLQYPLPQSLLLVQGPPTSDTGTQ